MKCKLFCAICEVMEPIYDRVTAVGHELYVKFHVHFYVGSQS